MPRRDANCTREADLFVGLVLVGPGAPIPKNSLIGGNGCQA